MRSAAQRGGALEVRAVHRAGPSEPRSPSHLHRSVFPDSGLELRSPFLRLSEDRFSAPAGFPMHPHRGMQTVTFVLDGALEHRDHTGAHSVLRPGDIQWMTAGSGVVHSELPHGREPVHTLQLWVNLPASRKMIPARYVDQRCDDTAVCRDDGVSVRVYAGRHDEASHDWGSEWPLALMDIRIKAGRRAAAQVPAGYRGFMLALEGRGRVGANEATVEAGETAWLDPASAPGRLSILADEPLRALLVAGAPIDEPIVAYGPFVMNTEDEIRQAFADYHSGRFP